MSGAVIFGARVARHPCLAYAWLLDPNENAVLATSPVSFLEHLKHQPFLLHMIFDPNLSRIDCRTFNRFFMSVFFFLKTL